MTQATSRLWYRAAALALAAGVLQACTRLPEAARTAGLTVERDIAYGSGARHTADVFRPAGAAALPGVLLVHGGGWVGGSKADIESDWTVPLARAGYVVASIEYRTGEPAPAAIRDVRAAAHWWCRAAPRYGVPPGRIAFAGFSAGAHLALMAALPPPADAELGPSCAPAAVVNFWGIADVADLLTGPNRRDFAVEWVRPADRGTDVAARWSPLTWAGAAAAPPVLSVHARRDPIVPFAHSEALTRRLGARGRLEAVEADWHAPGGAEREPVLAAAVAFLREVLR